MLTGGDTFAAFHLTAIKGMNNIYCRSSHLVGGDYPKTPAGCG
jgi:hypothetical protein